MAGKHRGIQVAVDLGKKAALAGLPISACPYPPSRTHQGAKWRELWIRGYKVEKEGAAK